MTQAESQSKAGRQSTVALRVPRNAPSYVLHTVPSLDPVYGGPARSVPALVAALHRIGVVAAARVEWGGGAGFDLVHDHGLWQPIHRTVAREASRLGVPRIVSPRGMLEPWALAQKRLKKRVAWHLYQRRGLTTASVLHATSEAEVEGIRRLGLRVPVALISNAVDVPDPVPPRERGEVRRALFLSRIHPKKGLPILVEAWACVRPVGWELVIAGSDDGGHRSYVEALVTDAGLTDGVSFAGPVTDTDKWALYGTADLFVLPTYSENFGLVVAEALGAGVPVLTTKGAPWRELETHACGWWTDVTVDAIADALTEATQTSRADLDAMGERGRDLVLGRYGWDAAARQMKAVYEWVLGRGDRPACVYLD